MAQTGARHPSSHYPRSNSASWPHSSSPIDTHIRSGAHRCLCQFDEDCRARQPRSVGRSARYAEQVSARSFGFPHNQPIDRCAMMAEHDFFKLLRLGAGELDYLGPLVGFFRDASCVLAGRQRKHLAAKVGNAWLDRGVSEDGVDLPVERVDDFGGCVLRRADTGPRARLETRYEVAKW